MTPRQRVLTALRHERPDRVPLFYRDVPEVRARLMAHFGCRTFDELSHDYHHSCCSVRQLIPDLLETGVEVLDPLQVEAAGMAPAELKAEFGNLLCFSGGVDEQNLLPRVTPDDVRAGVHRLLDVMAPRGGSFLGPTHNFRMTFPPRISWPCMRRRGNGAPVSRHSTGSCSCRCRTQRDYH